MQVQQSAMLLRRGVSTMSVCVPAHWPRARVQAFARQQCREDVAAHVWLEEGTEGTVCPTRVGYSHVTLGINSPPSALSHGRDS